MIVVAASNKGWSMYQMDVKLAFLNGYLAVFSYYKSIEIKAPKY